MVLMRSLVCLLIVSLLVPVAIAEEHHHHVAFSLETPEPIPVAPTGVTRTYTLTAKQWAFTFSPSPFVANVGDTVVINGTSSDVQHILLMERYVLGAGLKLDKGTTRTVTFTADQAGTFLFLCNQSSCGAGHSTMSGNFVVTAAAAPSISSVQPSSGSQGTTVTITGTNFVSGATVKFGTVAASSVTVQSATSIVATAPPQDAGTVSVSVTNPDGQSATFNGFTYVVPAPSIASVSPASGPSNGGTSVQISGNNFQSGATVTVGGKAALVLSATSSAITIVTPVAVATEQQSLAADVVVRNPDGQSATAAQAFRYTAVPLSVASVSPASGSNQGGSLVSISGTGFTSALAGASVTFGGVAGTSLAVLDAATLTVKVPAHANGTVDVAVTMGGQTVTARSAFTFEDTPPRRRTVKH